jgi:hypothetical protein
MSTNSSLRVLSALKNLFVTSETKTYSIQSGAFQGIKLKLDLSHQTQLFLGLYEREVFYWLNKLSKAIDSAIDIGAAEGEYTLYFLLKSRARRVFSFEPQATCRESLIANLKINQVNLDDERLILSSNLVGSGNGQDFCTLDALLPNITTPCLVKMDVDGGEVDILKGSKLLLEREDVAWIVETHSKQLEENCLCIFEKNGYHTKIIPNAWWRVFIPELRVGPLGSHNRWLIATKSTL